MKERIRPSVKAVQLYSNESAVLDIQGFSILAQIPKATILTLRSRAPEKLPPAYWQRPLRWRVETVMRWMEKREQHELGKIERIFRRT